MTARFALFLIAFASTNTPAGFGQTNHYKQVDLVSNVSGLALNLDHGLIDPWGLAVSGAQPFRIGNAGNGLFKSYDANGFPQIELGIVAAAPGQSGFSKVTGVAANSTGLFIPHGSLSSPFLYATANGTVSAEYADANGDILESTILVIDESAQGAAYTGIAVLTPSCCSPFLAVANFHERFIDTFTADFEPLGIPGAFVDPNLPADYAPYNINVVANQVFVTYAVEDAKAENVVIGAGNGIVDVYALDGTFVRRFDSNGALNAPWGVVQASAQFGEFGNDILIGNSGDGMINAFDPVTGQWMGQLRDGNGNALVNLDLHGMTFGSSGTGDQDTLYVTAGLGGGLNGLFAAISENTGRGPDFTLTASPAGATLSGGKPATFSVTAAPVGNFRGIFSFSCSAPSSVTCTLGGASIDAATGAATTTLTVAASPLVQAARSGSPVFALLCLAGLGCWRLRLSGNGNSGRRSEALLLLFGLTLAGFCAVGLSGCGSAMKPAPATPTSASVVITASTGPLSHSTTLTLALQ